MAIEQHLARLGGGGSGGELTGALPGRGKHAAARLGAAERPDEGHGGGNLVQHHRVEAGARDEQHECQPDAAQEGAHRV